MGKDAVRVDMSLFPGGEDSSSEDDNSTAGQHHALHQTQRGKCGCHVQGAVVACSLLLLCYGHVHLLPRVSKDC